MYCFQCAREYLEEVTECVECGVPLVAEPPTPPELVGEENEAQVAYELHEWTFESRRMVDQLLTGSSMSHGWQGATLIVREIDEDRVDALIEEVEEAEGPRLDPDVEKIGYTMDEWSADAQSMLADSLGLSGISHEFDSNGELIVAADDEEQVDELIERVTERLAIEETLGDASTVLEGIELNDLLGEVRSLAGKIVKNAGDAKSVLRMAKRAELLADIRTSTAASGGQFA